MTTLPHARINGAIDHVQRPAKPQGRIARAWFAVGTVLWVIAFGALSLAYFLTSDKWRADLREANGGEG